MHCCVCNSRVPWGKMESLVRWPPVSTDFIPPSLSAKTFRSVRMWYERTFAFDFRADGFGVCFSARKIERDRANIASLENGLAVATRILKVLPLSKIRRQMSLEDGHPAIPPSRSVMCLHLLFVCGGDS